VQDASPKTGESAAAAAMSARVLAWRRRLYEIVEHGPNEDLQARIFDVAIIGLIFLNIAAFVAETVPWIDAAYGRWLYAFEVFSIAVFTVEYALRLWTAVEVPFLKRMPAWRARLTFARRPSLIIDLLAILPFYLAAVFSIDLRVLRVLRLLRFLKLSRYSPALHTLIRVLQNERRALMGAGLLLLAAVLMASTGIYYLEGAAQPDKFGSVPDAAWWAMATLTTVGYGDVTPITPFGKLFGGIVMICGLCILALPVAIVSSGFAQEVSRHDFVINWSLMSRIPLLAELESRQVANIMPLLHAHNLPPGVELIRDGSQGDAMYFVAHGQVRQRTAAGEQTLAAGDFFGALALLENDVHRATVVTVSKCRLLKLYKQDFHRLENASPSVAAQIRLASSRPA
jgi:voltage-gated potassium channel